MTTVITNTAPCRTRCTWCGAYRRPHEAACPLGERYQQIQRAGGIGFLAHAADACGRCCDQHRERTRRPA